MHTVNMTTGEIINLQIKRSKVAEHFANHAPCLVAIESCGGAHLWARNLSKLGHTVRLLHAKVVRPQLHDPADELVLEAAVNASAQALLTFNLKHFTVAAEKFRLQVVQPGTFLRSLS